MSKEPSIGGLTVKLDMLMATNVDIRDSIRDLTREMMKMNVSVVTNSTNIASLVKTIESHCDSNDREFAEIKAGTVRWAAAITAVATAAAAAAAYYM